MKMENVKKIKELFKLSKHLKNFINNYNRVTSEKSCDKHNFEFRKLDSNFQVFCAEISLMAYTGYYGSSSCSTFLDLNSVDCEKYLIKYLNDNKQELLNAMAEMAESDALKMKNDARLELDSAYTLLNELDD